METFQVIFKRLIKDISVELNEEFNRNFERKSFFNKAWKANRKGTSILMKTGALRRSITLQVSGTEMKWQSSVPYADIHNSGGNITVTSKMKGFFYYKAKTYYKKNAKEQSAEYLFCIAMANKAIGSKIVIPKRQFIGDHPQVRSSVKDACDAWWNRDAKAYIERNLNEFMK